MVLNELAAYLVAQSLGTLGTTLFLGELTDGPDVCTALFAYPGMTGYRTNDEPGEALERPAVGVVVRGTSAGFAAAMTQAYAVWTALMRVTNMTLSGVRYVSVEGVTPPAQQGRDAHDRPLIGFRALVTKVPS